MYRHIYVIIPRTLIFKTIYREVTYTQCHISIGRFMINSLKF